ncbi:hypothetical protein HZU75_00955 [Chitinibacter fontanus]|uniref:Toxin CptA n=1 Tax=Chitinibacter fontanus TaxID=1737446 RepID=A0A7D5Z081_9NEIS|nr:protein YgfX [Chitinibacter fontanus]QLI80221.1 hypothetical protein HZU75_00955 [Chitinibacter fontanus]
MLPAVLHINPVSKWQRGFLLLTHSLTLLNAWWMSWPWAVLVSGVVLASWWWHWHQLPAVLQVQCLASGQLEVCMRGGEKYSMRILPSSVLTAHVLVLHLQGDGKKLYLVLWPDSANAEILRQWRVYLRWIWPASLVRDELDF